MQSAKIQHAVVSVDGEIQKRLQNLLSEGISVGYLMLQFLKPLLIMQQLQEIRIFSQNMSDRVETCNFRQIFPCCEVTSVVTLDPAVEQEIMGAVKNTEQGSYLTLDPERTKKIMQSLGEQLKKLEDMGKNPIVITSPIVRMYFKKLAMDYYKDIIVISYIKSRIKY